MSAQTAVSFFPACPLCGCSTPEGLSTPECRRRLGLQLRSLEAGSVHIAGLRSQITRMCGMCQMLMIGITSDDDRNELRARIQKELEAATAAPAEGAPGKRSGSAAA